MGGSWCWVAISLQVSLFPIHMPDMKPGGRMWDAAVNLCAELEVERPCQWEPESRQIKRENGSNWRSCRDKSLNISIIVLCCAPWGVWQCTVEWSLTGSALTIILSSSGEERLELLCPKGAFFLCKSYKEGKESHFLWGFLFSVM